MKRTALFLTIGLGFLLTAIPAIAHQQVIAGGPQASVAIWGDSNGHLAYTGSLHFGPQWVAAPFVSHGYGPAVRHSPRHGGRHHHGCKHSRRHASHHGHRKNRAHRHGHH